MATSEELVNVLVPRRHLSRVYALIGELEGAGSGTTPSPPSASGTAVAPANGTNDEWTPSRLRKMVDQSPPAMKNILKALADRPGEWLSTQELAKAIVDNPNADWMTVAGTIGAFGRRFRNRYGIDSPPFEKRYDHDVGGKVYRMSTDIAGQILDYLTNAG